MNPEVSMHWILEFHACFIPVGPDSNSGCINQSLGFQPENVVNPPAHKVFELLVSFYLDQAAKQ
jgi:hypothetical protein